MRRDKAVTRILLILSVVHFAASAPAIIPQRYPEVTKDVSPALEKRANSDDESSQAFPQMDNNLPTTSGTVLSHDDTPPAPGDPELHSDPSPELGVPQLNIDQAPTSGTLQLHNGEPPTPGAPTSQGDMSSASEDPQVHDDPSPWQQHANLRPPGEMLQGESSVVPQSDDDPWCPVHHPDCQWRPSPWQQQQHTNLRPPGEMLQGESSVFPQLDDDPWSDMHHTDSPWDVVRKVSEAPSFPDISETQETADTLQRLFDRVHKRSLGTSETSSEAPELQSDPPPAPGSPQVHDGGSEESRSSYRWHNNFFVIEGASSSSNFDSEAPLSHSKTPQPLESEALPAPDTHTVFNDAPKQKSKVYAGVGAAAGVSVGHALGGDKQHQTE